MFGPHPYTAPVYTKKSQLTPAENTTPYLDDLGKKCIQQVIGTLLFYAHAVDPTLLMTINAIAAKQASPTEKTAKALTHLLNYCATFLNAVVQFNAHDMVLHIHSDASYMSAEEVRSQAGGRFYLSAASADPTKQLATPSPPNGPVHTVCKVICNIMSSAAEEEIGALYVNTRKDEELRLALKEMGHPQPPTPVMTDNSMACGIANKMVKQHRTRAIDMRFYWVRDCCAQNHFIVYWAPG
eukprot:9803600-Ditylum_brightwellii.AAC.1